MVEEGHDVNTIAVSAVLICYNWPRNSDRYRRIAYFVDRFFPKISELQSRRIIRNGARPIWPPFCRAGTDFLPLQNGSSNVGQTGPAAADTRERFDQFLAGRSREPNSEAERDRLFQEFLDWQARERQ